MLKFPYRVEFTGIKVSKRRTVKVKRTFEVKAAGPIAAHEAVRKRIEAQRNLRGLVYPTYRSICLER